MRHIVIVSSNNNNYYYYYYYYKYDNDNRCEMRGESSATRSDAETSRSSRKPSQKIKLFRLYCK